MENLGQIPAIKQKISTASRAVIVAMHRLIFEEEGDRSNRRRLREFRGFRFGDASPEFRAKLQCAVGFTMGDLISICNVLGITYTGNAEQLRERIVRALMNIDSLRSVRDDEDDEDDESGGDDARGDNRNNEDDEGNEGGGAMHAEREVASRPVKGKRQNNSGHANQFVLNYRDIEDSVRTFNGTDSYPVERWINDFEEAAVMFGWDDLQMVVFAKRSLKGLAKLFIQSEGVVKSWKELKEVLSGEFSTRISSAELHRMLEGRRKREEETVREYFLTMRELASRGAMDLDALFSYVIDGIVDETGNKVILYGAKTIREFKDKLESYERISKSQLERVMKCAKSRDGSIKYSKGKFLREDNKSKTIDSQGDRTRMRCFNCGASGHRARDCDKKSLGKKCFVCNRFGHEAKNCNEKRGNNNNNNLNAKQTISLMSEPSPSVIKNIVIGDENLRALIDTGSPVSLVREDAFENLKKYKLIPTTRIFSGFGGAESETMGYFRAAACVDGSDFPLTFHVVPRKAINFGAIIGRDILEQADLSINQDRVIVHKKLATDFLAHINILEEESRTDIDIITDDEIRERVKKLINEYEPKKSKTTEIELKITLQDEKPIFQRPRRLPISEKKIVENQVKEWIEQGIVEPCSSEYASPVVVVKKKDGTPRVCIDYRPLNRIIERDRYPLPLIEEQIDKLKDARIFSTLDLKNGFFHVEVEEKSRKYTAFITHEGQYWFLKAPFGLSNSPPVFQRFVNQIFRPLVNTGIMTLYLDDIVILAADLAQAVDRLETVLVLASEYGLELNMKKCRFMKTRIEFLGQVIENGRVSPSPEKIKAVMRFPEPTSVKQVQSFLGLTGYFRKFISRYSTTAKPLSDLLQKDKKFQFGEAERKAFNELKRVLSSEPILRIFDPDLETELHTDASQDGIGAILLQRSPTDNRLHPVQYMSRKSQPAERKYKSYELEVLAVTEALEKFRIYLLGRKFKIVTDCAAFTQTMRKREVSPRIWRWIKNLEDFDYTLEHRPGTRMKHVDALSRNAIMAVTESGIIARIKAAQSNDADLNALIKAVEVKPSDEYTLMGGVLYKFIDGRDLLMVPDLMQNEIIQAVHYKGHSSSKRTEDAIRREYFIPELKKKVEKFIDNCIPCILANRKQGKLEGQLHPLPKGDVPLHTYHIDHLGPLESTSKNYNHILVVIDNFTKFVWLYPTKSTTSLEVIKKLTLQQQIFGSPACIISDRGTAFSSKEFKDYCEEEGIRHILVTTGLPRANGQVERVNRVIIPILTKLSLNDPTKWYRHVSRLQGILNSTYQRSIGISPFELLTGVKMRCKDDLRLKEMLEQAVQEQFHDERLALRRKAKTQIFKTQQENCKTFNKNRKVPQKYNVGDLVAIKRTQLCPGRKLRAKYLGPYSVIKVKHNDTYDVKRANPGEGPGITSTCAEFMKPWCRF